MANRSSKYGKVVICFAFGHCLDLANPVLIVLGSWFVGMSVSEVAAAMHRSLNSVFEVMLYVDGADAYDQPNSPITDLKVLEGIVKKAGFRPTRIKSPASKAAEIVEEMRKEKDCELKPRYVTTDVVFRIFCRYYEESRIEVLGDPDQPRSDQCVPINRIRNHDPRSICVLVQKEF